MTRVRLCAILLGPSKGGSTYAARKRFDLLKLRRRNGFDEALKAFYAPIVSRILARYSVGKAFGRYEPGHGRGLCACWHKCAWGVIRLTVKK